MKKILVLALLSAASAVASAETVGTTSTGTAQAGAQGGAVSIDSHEVVGGTRYSASTAIAPPLTSSNDTCMGSTSMGGAGYSFGFSVGSTWTDHNCTMLKNARELWNQGEHAASLSLLCTNDDIRYAISVSGGVLGRRKDGAVVREGCPMTKEEWIAKGRPMLDPLTGEPTASGTVVLAAPPTKPVTVTSIEPGGIVKTVTPIYTSAN